MIIGPTDNPTRRPTAWGPIRGGRRRVSSILSRGTSSLVGRGPIVVACTAVVGLAGCAAGARAQLSAADSMQAVMQAVELATTEYHNEVRSADALRRRSAIDAFVQRIRNDHDDEQVVTNHVAAFNLALDRIQQDGQIENARYLATIQNIRTLDEIAGGLKRLAIQSMTLDDELRRYMDDLIQRVDESNPQPQTTATD